MAIYLGVDPGLTGAFAVLDVHDDGTQTLTVTATPVAWFRSGGSTRRRRYDIPALLKALEALPQVALAYLEQQGARPEQGATSTFSTGFGFGVWQTALSGLHVPFAVVTPQKWRAVVHLPRQPAKTAKADVKAGVYAAARDRFPAVKIPRDHADAVMLAVAAALEHPGGETP